MSGMDYIAMPKVKPQGKVTFSEERSKQNIVDTLATIFAGETSRTAESQTYRRWLPGKSNVGRILLHDNGSQDRLLDMKVSGIGKAQRRCSAFLDQQQKSFVTRMEKKQNTWVREHSRRANALNQMGPKKRQQMLQREETATTLRPVSTEDVVIEEVSKEKNTNDKSLPKIGKNNAMTAVKDSETAKDRTTASPRHPSHRQFQRFPQIKRPDDEKKFEEVKPESAKKEEEKREREATELSIKKKKAQSRMPEETVLSETLPRIKVRFPNSKGRRKISRKNTPPSAGSFDPVNDDRFAQLTDSLVRVNIKENEINDVGNLISALLCGNRYLREFKKRWKKKHTKFKTDIDDFYLTKSR